MDDGDKRHECGSAEGLFLLVLLLVLFVLALVALAAGDGFCFEYC